MLLEDLGARHDDDRGDLAGAEPFHDAGRAQFVVQDYGQDTQVAKTLFVIGWDTVRVLGPPVAAFGASAAVLILRFKLLPRWLGALAVLVFLSGFAPWLAGVVLALWILLTSIVLLVEERKRPTAASA